MPSSSSNPGGEANLRGVLPLLNCSAHNKVAGIPLAFSAKQRSHPALDYASSAARFSHSNKTKL